MVLLLVEGDDKSDNIDGGRGILFQLAVGGVLAEKDGLHEDPKGLVDPFGNVNQACQKGINLGVLALPMLGEGNEAGSEWNQYLIIHFDIGNFSVGRAGVLLRIPWLKALPNLSWVGLPAAALVGEVAVGVLAFLIWLGERAMVDL